MTAITFDTYEFIKTLEEAGFEEKQAEAVSRALTKAHEQAGLATKGDIVMLKSDIAVLKGDIAVLDGKLDSIRWILLLIAILAVAPLINSLF